GVSRVVEAPAVRCAGRGGARVRLLPPVPATWLSLPRKWTRLVQHKCIKPQQPLLAHDKVRDVGEAVAGIVAESRYAAEDAAQLVSLDLGPPPPRLAPEAPPRPGATLVPPPFAPHPLRAATAATGDVGSPT